VKHFLSVKFLLTVSSHDIWYYFAYGIQSLVTRTLETHKVIVFKNK